MSMITRAELGSILERKGHLVLMASLALIILTNPFLHLFAGINWLVTVIFVLMLMAAANTVARQKHLFIIALLFGIPSLISQIAVLGVDSNWLETIRYLSTPLFLFWICALLLNDIVLRSHSVTTDLLLGAVNVYLMIGFAFAFVYGLIEHLQPGSFTGLEDLISASDRTLQYLYFSFITMSTLGYGDISPLTPYGMTAAYVQAVFGQLYLAILVARLVSLYMGTAASRKE